MEIQVYELLRDNWLLLLFLVLGLGYLVGNLRIFGTPVGPTIGVILAGLVFGHFGLSMNAGVSSFGFALFIFSVGIEAGPSFFSAFREDGPKYIALAAIVAVTGFTMARLLAHVFDFEPGFDAGLLAGALTSTPTLAGAQDAIQSGLATLPEGVSPAQALENVGVGYAITYLVGTVLVILVIRQVPSLLGIDLEASARAYARERGLVKTDDARSVSAEMLPMIRAYAVLPGTGGKTLAQRAAEVGQAGTPLRVRRGNELLDPDPDLALEDGDIVSLIASLQTHRWAQEHIGPEVLDTELLDFRVGASAIIILAPHVVGRSVRDLDLPRTHGCWVTGIVRAGIELPASDDVVLHKGDRLQLIGEEERLRELAQEIGYIEEEVEETDLVTFSFGIAGGILLGLFVFKLGGLAIGLGTAGGLLLMGIAIGYLSSLNPTFGRVPGAARYLLKELGLTLMMAAIGLNAGGGIVEGLTQLGPAILLSAVGVAIVPLAVGYAAGRKLLKLNPALLLGSLTGAMTSTPALSVVTGAAKSGVPAIGYAGTYTFANVMLTFAGAYMLML
ncbi:MAG: transporter [Deltaproteobacteria bacterium]|nr:transporter [Deltaproteobacteria bacterium]